MEARNQENLKELFEKFFNDRQADSYVEDVQKAEQILREHPAPEPSDMLIANIKAEIAMRLPARKARVLRLRIYKVAAVAAAIVIIAAISLQLSEKPNGEQIDRTYASIIPTEIWESDDITADDADLAVFVAEIEQIEDHVLTLQSGVDTGNGDNALTELEMELVEINGDFWKG